MSDELPEGLAAGRHRDLTGRRRYVWTRRAGLLLLCGFIAAALLNVFGQHQQTAVAQGGGVRMAVEAPHALRGGDLYQVHLAISTTTAIGSLNILLSQGFLDGFTINSVFPLASNQTSQNGPVALQYNRLAAGGRMEVFLEGQVNANTAGHRRWGIDIYDGARRLVGYHRTITVFP